MYAQIQKGILFPANNYPAFLQLSSHPQNHKYLINTSESSRFAAHSVRHIRPQVTDLHPEKQELFLGFEPEPYWGCLYAVLWDAPSSASKLHPPACRLNTRNCTNLLEMGLIHSFILSYVTK